MHELLPVPLAVERETGTRPNPSTCWRWSTKGIKGVVLETWMLGGRRVTNRTSVRRFIERRSLSTVSSDHPDATRIALDAMLATDQSAT